MKVNVNESLVPGDALRTTSNPIRRAAFGLVLCWLGVFAVAPVGAQVTVRVTSSPGTNVPVYGQVVDTITLANAGLSSISDVNVDLDLSSASGMTMRLGQMYASLTHGTASENERVAVLINRPGVSSSSAFGSSLQGINIKLDDAAGQNVYSISSDTGTYAADGRIGVNPFGTRVAYNSGDITAGLSALNGDWLASNKWSLLVADTQEGNQARFNSWSLEITGTAANDGVMDPGAGGEISMSGGGTQAIGARVNSTGLGAGAVALKSEEGQTLVFSNGLSGLGFRKTGAGALRIEGDSSSYNGQLDVEAGKLVVSGTLGSSSTLNVGNGGTLGGSGTIGALQIASGGTLAVGNSPGRLNAGNTTWAGGAKFAWEIDDFTGNSIDSLVGQGTNWDFLSVAGVLNLAATTSSKFIIDVISLLANDNTTRGSADNWDPLKGYSFAIATASGGIQIGGTEFSGYADQTAFDTALNGLFDIRTISFSNAPSSASLWNITTSSSGQTLLLNYNGGATAIPEPSSASMFVLGLAALLAKRRRCRR